MEDLLAVSNGKVRNAADIEAVESLLKKIEKKPMWEVIDFLVNIYERKFPEDAKARVTALTANRKALKNKYAASDDKGMRRLINIPEKLADLISYFYQDRINQDKIKFWRAFGKRYPQYSVPERQNI